MTDWRTDCTVRASTYSRRAKAAWDEATAAIRVLAGGRAADVAAGELYLGHLQSLISKWSRTLAELRGAIDVGNAISALQACEVLGQVAVNTEGLAATVRARARTVQAPPGETAADQVPRPESGPPPITPGEETAGISGWIVAFPFALFLAWLFGR